MPVILHIKHEDSAVKAHRKAAAGRVLSYCGDTLPPSRLLCFLDDNDSGSLNGERGRYQTIHKNTPLAGLPDYVRKHIDVDDERFFYYQRVVDELIYIYDSTCSNDIGLTMTLAHELQHSIQHSRARELWAVNSLIHQLPKSIIHDLKLTWPDVPTEREARIVSKRAAVNLFGEKRVTEYIDERIREHARDGEFSDWQFVRTLTPESSVDLAESTHFLFKRLSAYGPELNDILEKFKAYNPEDFGDINLNAFLQDV